MFEHIPFGVALLIGAVILAVIVVLYVSELVARRREEKNGNGPGAGEN